MFEQFLSLPALTVLDGREYIYFAQLSIKRFQKRTLSLILLVSVVVADITLTFLSRNFSFSDLICSNSSEWDSTGGQSCLLSWLMKLFGFCRIQFILRRILTQSHYQCKKQRVFQQILHTIQYSVGRFNKIFFENLNFLCIDWWWCWLMLMLFCISVFRWQTTNKVLITCSASNQT